MPADFSRYTCRLKPDEDFLNGPPSRRYRNRVAGVVHGFVRPAFGREANAVILADKYYLEIAPRRHSRKLPVALPDRQSLFRVVPIELNGGVRTFLIVVAIECTLSRHNRKGFKLDDMTRSSAFFRLDPRENGPSLFTDTVRVRVGQLRGRA